MATDRRIRASHRDRDSAADLISGAYAAGRLSREELHQRAAAAYSATTWGELRDLTADLPVQVPADGLPADLVRSRRTARPPGRCLILQLIAIVLTALGVGLSGLAAQLAAWVTAVVVTAVLLLPPALRMARPGSIPTPRSPGGGR